MQIRSPVGKPRTLSSIEECYQVFLDNGADKTTAKSVSMSVISNPLVAIEVDHVSVPSLHISLGVFKKLFDMYESEAHEIDCHMYECRKKTSDEDDKFGSSVFKKLIQNNIKTQLECKNKIEKKEQRLAEAEEEMPLIYL
ncbi:uncharacterized protein LOC117116845, partial [Anneissia japonica]|uniref:uncharacterized protein LOC117116845 n=1 Tax=Anneissia japonica TaxID=1529436 RepID=UPI001425AE30